MKEVKAFIRRNMVNGVLKALRDHDFRSVTVTEVEGTGRYTRPDNDEKTSLKFQLTHSKMSKLELVCKKEDVTNIVQIISEHGGTGEKGDGIVYVSEVEQIFKVSTGEESQHEL
ncbi:P-II family nitrogen regulator [Nafulsella turpanensis]|uniref:P-II family nitrogen regulator n=1 Tax=Nafulsella turpanensis TaxID=1265690 RepID=UPI00034A3239|nr:P-II family nitrogen regulator [Nafulsella turpanensis]